LMLRRPAGSSQIFSFGPFRLFPDQKLLLDGDESVRMGNRALDLLIALVTRAGEVVSKEDLLEYGWPNTTVIEANLRVHIAGIRKLLGDGQRDARYIMGVVGRGYCFVAPVTLSEDPARPSFERLAGISAKGLSAGATSWRRFPLVWSASVS